MEKKPYHHGNLDIALIEAGLSLVDREGLEGMTLRRVAGACGVSHAAPYKHFAGKEELLRAMQRYVEERFAQALEESYREPGEQEDPMLSMARAYLQFFQKNPHYFSFFQRHQEGYLVNLSDLGQESAYRPFEVFKQAAMENLRHLSLPEEAQRQIIISMWAMVHGCTAIAVMENVRYGGDWAALLAAILRDNMGIKGGHYGREEC